MPERYPPFRDGIDPSRKGGPPGGDDSEENWVCLGYDYHNRQDDAAMHRLLGFLTVFQLVALTFIWNYNTDFKRHDWAQREAYLEIARREALGLPIIDPDYIPPEKMLLPTDEELAALGEEPEILA